MSPSKWASPQQLRQALVRPWASLPLISRQLRANHASSSPISTTKCSAFYRSNEIPRRRRPCKPGPRPGPPSLPHHTLGFVLLPSSDGSALSLPPPTVASRPKRPTLNDHRSQYIRGQRRIRPRPATFPESNQREISQVCCRRTRPASSLKSNSPAVLAVADFENDPRRRIADLPPTPPNNTGFPPISIATTTRRNRGPPSIQPRRHKNPSRTAIVGATVRLFCFSNGISSACSRGSANLSQSE